MLGLGWTEMLVVGVVALIVIGPKDLPVVMQRIGKFAGQVRRMGSEFQRELNKTTGLDEVRNLRQSITEPLRKSTEEIRREFNAMTPSGPKPSGLIKPSDPAKESVADEIRAAAGMPPKVASEPVKAARPAPTTPPAKAVPVAESAVERKELAPVEAKPAPVKAPRTRKEALEQAAVQQAGEPAAPAPTAKKASTRKTPARAAKVTAEPAADAKPAKAAKPATARKPATRRKAAPKPAGGEG